ncbi:MULTISPECIES: hypothetical protein [unclassified Microcoleus]|uniref:hypothetical protein n=1 Tax=unclassified Microcoleus TaxID=2642155 RepID=UPI001D648E20|nr:MULTISPECIES: hypothetical protein [unclassified Microcoleus]MCC3464874.1 hypothetical protein [Microcoleus sp. PH2017_06_SFM_O_A]MCC3413981.1 hypothetical protein [Microcoleus sp. PH2017_02_FOX_O_A]MCC3425868.1 hypothetical protein [Microcoleus sp. PH2017_01_SCD_O_A]MCC3455673.1 hypothetical protein [Microcoleus sp. PH2017_08_TRC_O_A]MCC3499575.1 hypothetical protein [Microcoleus sp. PH2017_15_JOR_U_A]
MSDIISTDLLAPIAQRCGDTAQIVLTVDGEAIRSRRSPTKHNTEQFCFLQQPRFSKP